MIKTSIIIPTLNEEKYIATCMNSIIDSDLDKECIEILVVDGKSSDKTVEIVKNYMDKYAFIKLLTNQKRIIPSAINIGIKEAVGKYIIRIDAHSVYPRDYFTKLLYWSQKLDADNVGGVCITDVKNKNKKTESIKSVLTSRFGAGGVAYKEHIDAPLKSNTIPFGCFRADTFKRYGYFDERLERTEDLEINKRLMDRGGKVYLVPDVSFTYFARETFIELAKKSFNTGKWIVLSAYISNSIKALHLHHVIPLLFVISLIVPLLLCLVNQIFFFLLLVPLISYISLILYTAYRLKSSKNSYYYMIITFFVLHLLYGIGSLYAICKILIGKNYSK